MQIQVRTDNHIEGSERLKTFVRERVQHVLDHFSAQLTRVEVHMQDQNSHKPGDHDKRCTMEARVAGLQPLSVTHDDGTLEKALAGALDKMQSRLSTAIGRISRR